MRATIQHSRFTLVIHKGPLRFTRPFLMADQLMKLILAPTALALSTSLLAAGLPKVAVRKHLIAFSLSSPLSAIYTYYALSFLGGSGRLMGWHRTSNPGTWSGHIDAVQAVTLILISTGRLFPLHCDCVAAHLFAWSKLPGPDNPV